MHEFTDDRPSSHTHDWGETRDDSVAQCALCGHVHAPDADCDFSDHA